MAEILKKPRTAGIAQNRRENVAMVVKDIFKREKVDHEKYDLEKIC